MGGAFRGSASRHCFAPLFRATVSRGPLVCVPVLRPTLAQRRPGSPLGLRHHRGLRAPSEASANGACARTPTPSTPVADWPAKEHRTSRHSANKWNLTPIGEARICGGALGRHSRRMVGFAGAGPIRACHRGGAQTTVVTPARWSAREHLRERGPENADHASRQREVSTRSQRGSQREVSARNRREPTPHTHSIGSSAVGSLRACSNSLPSSLCSVSSSLSLRLA